MFNLPEETWWGSITGGNAKKYNREIEKNQANSINQFTTAGKEIVNTLTEYGADSEKFARKKMGEKYDKEVAEVDSAFSQQQANALSRATMSGAGVSSTAMYSQTKGEGMKQEALSSKENELQEQSLRQSIAPHQASQYNAKGGFSMFSSMGKKDERSALNKLIEGGLSALGSAVPYF